MIWYKTENNEIYTAHVGDKTSINFNAKIITWLQADGDELQYIRNEFINVPNHMRSVVRWHGDIAKFIAANF